MKTRIALAALVAAIALVCPAQATLTSTSSSVTYIGNGATTSFTVPFKFLASTDLLVTVAGSAKTLNVDYAVTGAGNATGTVKFTTAPAVSASVVINRAVDYTQKTSLAQNRTPDPRTVESALDKLAMGEQQLQALYTNPPATILPSNVTARLNGIRFADQFANIQAAITDAGATGSVIIPSTYSASDAYTNPNGIAILDLRIGANATGTKTPFVPSGTGAAVRPINDKLRDIVAVTDFTGADPTGVADSSTALQAALNTGKRVFCPSGTYKVVTSLFMQTNGQEFFGDCTLTMDASLAKPVLWLGASDAIGTPSSASIFNMKVTGIQFLGTGTKTLGSSGIAFQKATTATLNTVRSWNFYAGIDVRGLSLVNTLLNPDLRQNRIGLWDRTDASGTIDFQGTRIQGGRIESNGGEGIVAGTQDLAVFGTTIEGNASVTFGGAGTEPEIRLTQGLGPGSFTCVDCHIESTSTSTSVLQVDANACRFVDFLGGFVAANAAGTKYLVKTLSNCTSQSVAFYGGRYSTFKNYVQGTIANNSGAMVLPSFSDVSVDASADLTVTGGASIMQYDRGIGLKITGGAAAGLTPGSVTFATLGAPGNGKVLYCSDCTIANPCAGAGTGALAKRINGAWVCN